MDKNVEKFSHDILEINDTDYGDFMRKANHYLQDLKKALAPLPNPEIKNKLNQMQTYIQYTPNWEVEPTVRQILKDISVLDNLMINSHKSMDVNFFHPL